MIKSSNPFLAIREALAKFDISPRVEPNETIQLERAYFPAGHRGVLDSRRQLVVGNRGMGKSFWTHALINSELRIRLADVYGHTSLKLTRVEIGFNGSSKVGRFAPTSDEIRDLHAKGFDPDLIWRGVLMGIAQAMGRPAPSPKPDLPKLVADLQATPQLFSSTLSALDDNLANQGQHLLVVFDALDRLGQDWPSIRAFSRALLRLAVGLKSFSSIRAKIFMRVDQFSDEELFRFPDSSKIRNDHVSLTWQASELYGLLLFEVLRSVAGGSALTTVASEINASAALPVDGFDSRGQVEDQRRLIEHLAGEFMGSNKKRGLVYTWVPLHLSDAANTCSPRTFLTAWKKAAEHLPAPAHRAVDHQGLLDGVRSASTSRLNELYEDYEWIRPSLGALRRQFVPMSRELLFELWRHNKVISAIKAPQAGDQVNRVPARLADGDAPDELLEAMKSVSVMEERSNGKINVPDIFRVEAEILRKGGVAVPKRG